MKLIAEDSISLGVPFESLGVTGAANFHYDSVATFRGGTTYLRLTIYPTIVVSTVASVIRKLALPRPILERRPPSGSFFSVRVICTPFYATYYR